MNDDWRLEIDPGGDGGAIVERLASRELEHDLELAFGETVIVSRNGEVVFLYAGTRAQAERAGETVDQLARDNGWSVEAMLTHWHPEAEKWEDPDAPLPQTDAERAVEQEEANAEERAEVSADGDVVFEVRIELDSHRDAVALAERLQAEGLSVVRRWKYLVVGATDEKAAKDLADRLGEDAPEGAEVTVEGSGQVAWAERPANPFAIFGGLGG